MNGYKRLIKNQSTRLAILKGLRFVPDSIMIKIQYRIKTGNKLDINDPKRYTEKLQWYKLNYRKELMRKCADKYTVREYIEDKGLAHLLNPLFCVFDSPEDVNFDGLPEEFAIKCSVGSGLNYFVHDKSAEDIEKIRAIVRKWFKDDSYAYGREWCYKNPKPRVLIEKLIPRNSENDIPDYKFFCFNGNVFCLYTMIDYTDNHENGKLGFFDRDFNQLPYGRQDFKFIDRPVEKPKCFDEMVEAAEILSQDFPHVRVDFYDAGDHPIFCELTFYNASGYTKFAPDEFDFILGKEFDITRIGGGYNYIIYTLVCATNEWRVVA